MRTENISSMLVSGMNKGIKILQLLVDSVVAQGGYEEMICCLASDSDNASKTIRKLAEVIVKNDWRVPKSLIEKLVIDISSSENGAMYVEYDRSLYWNYIDLATKFGIPVIKFHNRAGEKLPPIPKSILEQILGKKLSFPLQIIWQGEDYIVVSEDDLVDFENCMGEDSPNDESHLYIAPVKFFDLDA